MDQMGHKQKDLQKSQGKKNERMAVVYPEDKKK